MEELRAIESQVEKTSCEDAFMVSMTSGVCGSMATYAAPVACFSKPPFTQLFEATYT